MTHRVTLASNPRMLLLGLVLLALPAIGVLLLVYAGTLIGVVALAGAAYLDYSMVRFLCRNLRSRVVTSDTGMSCRLSSGEELVFPWPAVTIAGYCVQPRGRPFLFVYDEKMDKIVTIPDEYSLFEELKSELRRRIPPAVFQEVSLEAGQTIQQRLRPLIHPGEG
jgi:hypothetical protein